MKYLVENSAEQKFSVFLSSPEEKKILSFMELPSGWHYGEGGPISLKSIGQALQIYYRGKRYGFKIDAFPGIDGEIQVCCYHGNDTLEFTIETDGRITYVLEAGENETFHENLTLMQALTKLDEYGRGICHLSESSTPGITRDRRGDSAVWRLETPPTAAESRWFLSSAA